MHIVASCHKYTILREREKKTMEDLERQAIEIIKSGEPLPVDIYINLNNSGIDPEFLIKHFSEKEEEEEEDQLILINKYQTLLGEFDGR
jgi:hypothetical protein